MFVVFTTYNDQAAQAHTHTGARAHTHTRGPVDRTSLERHHLLKVSTAGKASISEVICKHCGIGQQMHQ